jgi:hypothetical protein
LPRRRTFETSRSGRAPTAAALAVLVLAVASSGSAAPATACRAGPTKAAVTRFVTAFNRGDLRTVDHLFGAIGVFRWYSTTAPGQRRGRAAYDRQTLIPYLRARVRAGERLRLLAFRFSADVPRSLGHMNGTLQRSARGYPMRTFAYKGSADCSGGDPVLVVWSMAGPLG